jgi:hypothetical protein
MYTSPDDARSDVMLAGAVFVFGPIVISLLLATIPLARIPFVGSGLQLATPVLLTALVPFLMVRYRRERWESYGFGGDVGGGLVAGAVLALPIVAAGLLVAVFQGRSPIAALPLLGVGPGWFFGTAVRVLTWVGLAVLAVYVTVKARDAFRADYRTLPEGILEIGRVLAIVVGVAGLLRLAVTGLVSSIVFPVGVAAMVWLLYRQVQGPSSTSRATLLAPTILLAVGSFFISFSAARLVEGIWTGALVAAVGLAMGVLLERRRSAWSVIGLALAIALLTPMPVPLRLLF